MRRWAAFSDTPWAERGRVRLSATLSVYLGRQVLLGIIVALFSLGAIGFVVDTVELLRRARGRPEIELDAVLVMAALHLPFLVQKLTPFAVLFGTMFTFQRLTRSHELVVARAVGVSVWQFLTPAIVVAAGLGVFMVIAFNPLAAATVAHYQKLERLLFSSSASLVAVSDGGFWLRQRTDERDLLIHARQMVRNPPVLERVTVFFYDDGVAFGGRIDAPIARLQPGHWELEDALVARPDGSRRREPSVTIPTELSPDRIQESFAPPETMSFWALPAFIDSLEAVGFSAREHRMYWHGLLALPLLLSAMLLIATTFSLRLVRRGGTGRLIAAGVATGFVFYGLSDVVFAVGLSGRLPVVLAAWTPAGVAVLLGATTLLHLEDG